VLSITKRFATLSIAILAAGCGASNDAAEAQFEDEDVESSSSGVTGTVTTTTRVVLICIASSSFEVFLDTETPAAVDPSASFQVTVRVRDFFPSPTPFAGTLTATQHLLASNATPASSSIALPVLHFPAGQPILDLGTGTATLTAPAAVGSPITLDAGNFSYRIVPDDPIHNTFANDCEAVGDPAAPVPPTLAVIPVVRIPTSKDDCKHGGWRSFTDDEGTPFRNQGECIRFVQ
jgi:hypothetical protein